MDRSRSSDENAPAAPRASAGLGLFGETGSLLSEVKKKQRNRASYIGYAAAAVQELGDVLWYLTVVAARGGLTLGDIAANLNRGFLDWQRTGDTTLSFASLQPAIMPQPTEPSAAFEKTLLQLAGEVGHRPRSWPVDGQSIGARRPLDRYHPHPIQAANEAGVTLGAAAIKNLRKIFDRWPQERIYPPPLDTEAESEEQLPRELYVDVFERKVRGQTYVFRRCNGLNIGDRLTDNAMTADDYRFHDVFHYAYVAVLVWSPVIRSLFRLKRKSEPKVDDAQDGARATLIEEGVTTWIFGQAIDLDFFANMEAGDLPFDLLMHVRQFVAGYETEQCPLRLWEQAILEGYAAFRCLREHRRERIHIDMNHHRLSFGMLP